MQRRSLTVSQTTQLWSKYPDLPTQFRAPGVSVYGGMVLLVGSAQTQPVPEALTQVRGWPSWL